MDTDADTEGNQNALTFPPDDWSTEQTVTVSAAVDTDTTKDAFTLTHTVNRSRSASEYRSVSAATLSGTVTETTVNYDNDGDGLIEIENRDQLNAIRYDLDGNQEADDPANDAAYKRAFPQAGCVAADGEPPASRACEGYELVNDIRLSGSWTPIPDFRATLDGNGNTVTGLSISRANDAAVGMFAYNSGTVRNLGLAGVNVRGDGSVGALVGQNGGMITGVWSTGRVSGNSHVGGLVGFNRNEGTVQKSYSEVNVTGLSQSVRTAGLVGLNRGMVRNTYATGSVSGASHAAGRVGWNDKSGTVENSYAAGRVTGEFAAGGLVGWQTATVTRSYWDTQATGQSQGAGQGDAGGATGLTTAEMRALTAPTGWDTDIWNFPDGDYPCLQGVGDCE